MSENLPVPVLFRPLRWGDRSVTVGDFVLPTGTVTLLLADVEGSTRGWESDPKTTEGALVDLNRLVDDLVGRFDGVRPVEQGEGDSFVAAFGRARDAIGCAVAVQQALVGFPLRVRLGVHTGDVMRRDDGNYVGPEIIRTARLRNLAHGGQTVVSEATKELVADALTDGVSLRDLGVHRLKDLSRPVRVFQLCHPDLEDAFPPLRSLDNHRHNLPVQRTAFIGRAAELSEVSRLVGSERLVTLTGSGGCGKTRLALHVGGDVLNRFDDGVWFVALGAVTEPDAVAVSATQVFALRDGPATSPTDTLVAYLGERRVLLIVDNCEHLLDAAGGLVDAVLASCPGVSVLATSRQPLGVDGEVTWRVPSLVVPADGGPSGIAGVSACEAAQLFADRARRARSGFALSDHNAKAVAEICRRLDGIPLAIELAAARVRVFTPAQIAEGLSERFRLLSGASRTALPRQQTLEASVDWSHALLTEIEQIVFRRLAVFAGDFTFAAARDVSAGPVVEAHQVLDVLSLLVDKSLVVADVDDDEQVARYRLLETVRHYATARLAGTGEEVAARNRHRDHYLAVAEEAEAHLEGPDQRERVSLVARDYPNIRAALAWSRDRREYVVFARMAAALAVFWPCRGSINEGESWLDAAIGAGDELPAVLRARALFGRAWLATLDFDAATLIGLGKDGLALARQLGDERLIGRFLIVIGTGTSLGGGPATVLEEGVEQARLAGDGWALAGGLFWLGSRSLQQDPERATALLEESVQVGRQANPQLANVSLGTLGGALACQGELRQSREVLEAALALADAAADSWAVATALTFLVSTLISMNDLDEALRTLERLDATWREGGFRLGAMLGPNMRGMAALARGDGDGALRLARDTLPLAAIPGMRAGLLQRLIEAELAVGSIEEARTHVVELIEICTAADVDNTLSTARLLEARVARKDGDTASAAALVTDALQDAWAIPSKATVIDGLEILAGLAAEQESFDAAARLFGAAQAARDATGYGWSVAERDADLGALRTSMEPAAFQLVWDEGRTLTLADAVAYARRRRGERRRPAIGWAALTPAETQVVGLVKQGLTNPEIAERLFISPRTVQAHLTHVFAKLGISSRSALAAEAARHPD